MEKEQRPLRELRIKYKNLEAKYEKDKQKYDTERAKAKLEMAALKNRIDEAVTELGEHDLSI